MIHKLKTALASPVYTRIANLLFVVMLLALVLLCFYKVSSAMVTLSHSF